MSGKAVRGNGGSAAVGQGEFETEQNPGCQAPFRELIECAQKYASIFSCTLLVITLLILLHFEFIFYLRLLLFHQLFILFYYLQLVLAFEVSFVEPLQTEFEFLLAPKTPLSLVLRDRVI